MTPLSPTELRKQARQVMMDAARDVSVKGMKYHGFSMDAMKRTEKALDDVLSLFHKALEAHRRADMEYVIGDELSTADIDPLTSPRSFEGRTAENHLKRQQRQRMEERLSNPHKTKEES